MKEEVPIQNIGEEPDLTYVEEPRAIVDTREDFPKSSSHDLQGAMGKSW